MNRAIQATIPEAIAVNQEPTNSTTVQLPTDDLADFALSQAIQPASTTPSNPFDDLSSLRLGQDFAAILNATSQVLRVRVHKPSNEAFIRTHPSEDHRFAATLIALKEENEFYLVHNHLRDHLASEPTLGAYLLFTAISRPGGHLFLWPVRLPGPDGHLNSWPQSAIDIATGVATKNWVRVVSVKSIGAYVPLVAPAGDSWGEPKWPALTMGKILELAFKDKVIDSLDHHVLRRLRGEA